MQATSEPADRVVRAFLGALAEVRRELPAAGARTVQDLVRLARSRQVPREAKLDSGLEYAIHGVGCRFTTAGGLEVDVDVEGDGTEVFDAWRVSNFADSAAGSGDPGRPELTAALRRLAAAGELREVRPGWFATRVSPVPPR